MGKFTHIEAAVFGEPWAILPDKKDAIAEVIEARLDGAVKVPYQEYRQPEVETTEDGIAVIPIQGTISKRMNIFSSFSGGTSSQVAAKQVLDALEDPAIKAILLDIDSPGGMVDGTPALADAIYEGRTRKPIVAFCDGMATSGAYWIACAAHEVIATGTAQIGHIGVIVTHTFSLVQDHQVGLQKTVFTGGRLKAARGSSDQMLNSDGRAEIQGQVDQIYSMFVEAVARNRGVSLETAYGSMAEGRIFIGTKAVEAGLADSIGEKSAALARAREMAGIAGRGLGKQMGRMGRMGPMGFMGLGGEAKAQTEDNTEVGDMGNNGSSVENKANEGGGEGTVEKQTEEPKAAVKPVEEPKAPEQDAKAEAILETCANLGLDAKAASEILKSGQSVQAMTQMAIAKAQEKNGAPLAIAKHSDTPKTETAEDRIKAECDAFAETRKRLGLEK